MGKKLNDRQFALDIVVSSMDKDQFVSYICYFPESMARFKFPYFPDAMVSIVGVLRIKLLPFRTKYLMSTIGNISCGSTLTTGNRLPITIINMTFLSSDSSVPSISSPTDG
jgi:hypothetical protein